VNSFLLLLARVAQLGVQHGFPRISGLLSSLAADLAVGDMLENQTLKTP
jgi:hypothetical protein